MYHMLYLILFMAYQEFFSLQRGPSSFAVRCGSACVALALQEWSRSSFAAWGLGMVHRGWSPRRFM
jgi:hypothetical protein